MMHYSAAITSLLPQHLFKAIVTCKYIPPTSSLLGHVQVRSVRGGSLCGVQVRLHDAAGQRHHKGQSHLPPHSFTYTLTHTVNRPLIWWGSQWVSESVNWEGLSQSGLQFLDHLSYCKTNRIEEGKKRKKSIEKQNRALAVAYFRILSPLLSPFSPPSSSTSLILSSVGR